VYFLKYLYSDLLIRLFTVFARYRLPTLAALLLPIYIRKLKNADKSCQAINVLVIPKQSFDEDILASLGVNNQYQLSFFFHTILSRLRQAKTEVVTKVRTGH